MPDSIVKRVAKCYGKRGGLRFTGNISINLSKEGDFISVTNGSQIFSMEAWNKSIQDKF
jgi:hypothetical protein